MSEIEKLAYFFRNAAFIMPKALSNYRDIWVDPPDLLFEGASARVINALVLGETRSSEDSAKKGLSLVGKLRFEDFGIVFPIPKYYAPTNHRKLFGNFFANMLLNGSAYYLRTCEREAGDIVDEWVSGKGTPERVLSVFSDPYERQEKLFLMLGIQTYKHRCNKQIGEKTRRAMNETHDYNARIYRENAKAIAEVRAKRLQSGLDPLTARELDGATDLFMCCMVHDCVMPLFEQGVLPLTDGLSSSPAEELPLFERVYPSEAEEFCGALYCTKTALCKAAVEIRDSYPKKGWEVRQGLVHKEDYSHLLQLAITKHCADPVKAAVIIAAHFGRPFEFNFSAEQQAHADSLVRALEQEGCESFEWEDLTEFQPYDLRRSFFAGYSVQRSDSHTKVCVAPPAFIDEEEDLCWGWGAGGESFCMGNCFPSRRGKFYVELPSCRISLNEYSQIGKLRIGDFARGMRPYKHEAGLLKKILTSALNKQQFHNKVDQLLGEEGKETISWGALEQEIRASREHPSMPVR